MKSRAAAALPDQPGKENTQGGGDPAGAGAAQPLAAQEAEKANQEQ